MDASASARFSASDMASYIAPVSAFFLAENARSLLQSTSEFLVRRLQISQALLPLALKPAGDQPVVRINGPIAPLRAAGLSARDVARALVAEQGIARNVAYRLAQEED